MPCVRKRLIPIYNCLPMQEWQRLGDNDNVLTEGRTGMLIQVVTTMAFHLPDEYEAEKDFIANNDMSQWKKYEDTQYNYYIRTDRNTVMYKGDSND